MNSQSTIPGDTATNIASTPIFSVSQLGTLDQYTPCIHCETNHNPWIHRLFIRISSIPAGTIVNAV